MMTSLHIIIAWAFCCCLTFSDDNICNQCTCIQVLRTVTCTGLLFEFIPQLPVWAENLYIRHCHITTLGPSSFKHVPQLKQLAIVNSGLEILSRDVFVGSENVSVLDLSNNHLSDIPAGSFLPLNKLAYLNVSNNQLHSYAPFDVKCFAAPELMSLALAGNQLVAQGLNILPPVRYLNVANNKVTTVGNAALNFANSLYRNDTIEIFTESLESLDVSWTGANISENFYLSFRNLKYLNVAGCVVSFIENFNLMNALKSLNLSAAKLSVDEWSTFPPRLEILDISYLGITRVDFSNIQSPDQSKLRRINAANNRLQQLRFLEYAQHLEHLDASNNSLTEIPFVAGDMPLKYLARLDLSFNKIRLIDQESLEQFSHLVFLNLSFNRLVDVHPKAFVKLPRLLFVDLSHNALEAAPLANNVALTTYLLNNNHLEELTQPEKQTTATLHKIDLLDLSNNPKLLAAAQQSCSVMHVREDGNGASICYPKWLDTLSIQYAGLQRLLLQNTGITALPTGPLSRLHFLSNLDISRNSLTSKYLDFLLSSNVVCLASLDVSQNNLSSAPGLEIFMSPCFKMVDLSLNPFTCSCQLLPLIAYASKLRNFDNASLYTCTVPLSDDSTRHISIAAYLVEHCGHSDVQGDQTATFTLGILAAILITILIAILVARRFAGYRRRFRSLAYANLYVATADLNSPDDV